MGKNSSPVINYWYGLTMHMGECCAADTLYEVRGGDRTAWQGTLNGSGVITINQPGLYGGEKSEGGLVGTLTILNGDPTQVQSAILAPIEPGPRPAYRGLYTTVWDGDAGAASKSIKAISKLLGRWLSGWGVPVWHPELVQIGDGMNPAHIIYDLLTDPNCGGRDPATTFDDAQMLAAATTLYNEGFGLCLKWTSSLGIGKFIQTVCDHVGATWVEDPTTGLAYLKLIRADYDPATLPVLDESNVLKLLTYKQATLANAVNEVSVTYHDVTTNKDAAVTAQNLANVQAQGRVIQQSTSYPGLHTHDQAARAAMRDCTVASSLLLQIKVKVKSGGPNGLYGTKKGDVLSFSWGRKSLVSMPVRVLEADYGVLADNGITLTCVQDVFGLPATTYLVSQPSLWTAPNMAPQPVPLQVLEEASYRDLAAYMSAADLAQVGSTSGYLTTIANRPNGMSLNYTLQARVGTTGLFVEVGSGSFAPTGVLTADIGPGATSVVLTDVDNLAHANLGEALLGSERVRVDAIDLTTNAVTIARGCVDTVPALLHAAGTQIWFTERYTGYGKTEYLTGELIQALLLTNTGLGQLDPTLALTGSLTLNDRQIRPYPPGNLQINGAHYPANATGALVLTWSHRDRLLSADQLVDTTQGNIGPEVGTTYTVKVYLNGTLDSTTSGITGTTLTPTVSAGGTVRVDITSQRDSLDSWQALSATFGYVASALAISGAAPDGTPGTAYSYTYGRTGGVGPFTWSITVGSLPSGLTLNTSTGQITGTPTTAGTYSWTVEVMDSLGNTASEPDGVTIGYATLTLSGTYAAATVGTAYSSDLTIAGGNGVYSNSRATVGSVPAGLALSIVGSALRLSGTPTTGGTVSFTAAVDSGDGQTATSAQSVVVAASGSSALLHFDGTDGSTAFIDESGKTWSRAGGGGAAALSTTQAKFGSASLKTALSLDAISTPNHTDFQLGSGDFNISVQLYPAGGALGHYQGIVTKDDTAATSGTRGWLMYVDISTQKLMFSCYEGGVVFTVADPSAMPSATWTQYEVERYGSTMTLYKNGVSVASTAISGTLNAPLFQVTVGSFMNSGAISDNTQFVGWIDELRIRKQAVRMGNFTPDTTAFSS